MTADIIRSNKSYYPLKAIKTFQTTGCFQDMCMGNTRGYSHLIWVNNMRKARGTMGYSQMALKVSGRKFH